MMALIPVTIIFTLTALGLIGSVLYRHGNSSHDIERVTIHDLRKKAERLSRKHYGCSYETFKTLHNRGLVSCTSENFELRMLHAIITRLERTL